MARWPLPLGLTALSLLAAALEPPVCTGCDEPTVQPEQVETLLQTAFAITAAGKAVPDKPGAAWRSEGAGAGRSVKAAKPNSMLTVTARRRETLGMPINSNGKHAASALDIVLLIICLLVPFVLYLVIETWERANEEPPRGSAQDIPAHSSDPHHARRLGSSYDLAPQSTNVSLTPLQGKREDEKDGTFLQNALAGFSTAMAALPDAISFSFITGVSPLNGIWAGVFMGLSAALVGGRPGMISSASAATAVVLADISTASDMGMGWMALTVFIVGILQLLIAQFRLSRFITMVPHPVMLGFVNGLAIVMVQAQLRQYRENGDGAWVPKDTIIGMTITALFAMLVAVCWSRIPHANLIMPAPLASVVLTAVFSIVFQHIVTRRTLRDVAGGNTFAGGRSALPSWDFPPVGVQWGDTGKLGKVISNAVRFAVVGILESLMTQSLIDQITGKQGSARRECYGQGLGNILSSFFGLQGGCALIAQSLMNVGSGGRTRVSGTCMALTLAACVVILPPVMAQIPVAALVGLITLIAINTFAWGSFELITRINLIDAVVVVVVTIVTVWKDLAVAVFTGIIISGLGFAWHAATEVNVDVHVEDDGKQRWFTVGGPLFFGSAMNYRTAVCSAPFPEEVAVLEFSKARVLDLSGVDAIGGAVKHLNDQSKQVRIRGLAEDILAQLPNNLQFSAEPRSQVQAPGSEQSKEDQ